MLFYDILFRFWKSFDFKLQYFTIFYSLRFLLLFSCQLFFIKILCFFYFYVVVFYFGLIHSFFYAFVQVELRTKKKKIRKDWWKNEEKIIKRLNLFRYFYEKCFSYFYKIDSKVARSNLPIRLLIFTNHNTINIYFAFCCCCSNGLIL